MSMINILASLLLIAIVICSPAYWYVIKRKPDIHRHHRWKAILLSGATSITQTQDAVRSLYKHRVITNMGMSEGVMYFQDRPSAWSWGNTYVVKETEGGNSVTLYIKGSMHEPRIDKANASSISVYLGGEFT